MMGFFCAFFPFSIALESFKDLNKRKENIYVMKILFLEYQFLFLFVIQKNCMNTVMYCECPRKDIRYCTSFGFHTEPRPECSCQTITVRKYILCLTDSIIGKQKVTSLLDSTLTFVSKDTAGTFWHTPI